MIILTNDFHHTKVQIRAGEGGTGFQSSTIRRVSKRLCGMADCQCSGEDGTRGSEYQLVRLGFDRDAEIVVVKR